MAAAAAGRVLARTRHGFPGLHASSKEGISDRNTLLNPPYSYVIRLLCHQRRMVSPKASTVCQIGGTVATHCMSAQCLIDHVMMMPGIISAGLARRGNSRRVHEREEAPVTEMCAHPECQRCSARVV